MDNNEIIVKLPNSLGTVSKLLNVTFNTTGETTETYYRKQLSLSYNDMLYSDYIDISPESLRSIKVNPDKELYLKFKLTQVGEGELSFNGISSIDLIHSTTQNNIDKVSPKCIVQQSGPCGDTPLVYNSCKENIFNPYTLGKFSQVYQQLSSMVNDIFGICVTYFKVNPQKHSSDSFLNEYSLLNVESVNPIKILVPNNELPTQELRFNPNMIDYPNEFEAHIVKADFRRVFGANSHPQENDYLYFQQYMNKMYQIDSVAEPDIYLGQEYENSSSYWRVSLVPYQQKQAIHMTEDLREMTDTLVLSEEEKFREEHDAEFKDVDVVSQNSTLIEQGGDNIRSHINKDIIFEEENIVINSTIVADTYYNFNNITTGDTKAIQYRYSNAFSSEDERLITFLIKPQTNASLPIPITNITGNKKHSTIEFSPTSTSKFNVGDYITISRTGKYNGRHKIKSISKTEIKIDVPFIEDQLSSTSKFTITTNSQIINITKGVNTFNISVQNDGIMVNINKDSYFYPLNNTFDPEKWYGVVWGMGDGFSNCWVYSVDEETESFIFQSSSSANISQFEIPQKATYSISSTSSYITNIRIWNKLYTEEEIPSILSQQDIDEKRNIEISDNAIKPLDVASKYAR